MDLPRELEDYLHAHIPISEYMGVTVLEANEERVRLHLPLEPNINHRQTVFGGSESAAAILSAWSLLWVRLRNHESHPKLVIRANSIEYTKPIESEFQAETQPISQEEWNKFLVGLERKGKGRIPIRARLLAEDQVCGEFSGTFVALVDLIAPSYGAAANSQQ